MQHTIPIDQIGPAGMEMARAVEKCVHCGFCLPTCPTYVMLGEEMDSPRGRILLMKSALEGALEVEATLPFVDRCLGCMACVTACPSGVQYGELLMPYRERAESLRHRPAAEKLARVLVRETLPHPGRFRLAAAAGRLAEPLHALLPASLSGMLALAPKHLPPQGPPLPAVYPAEGARRARVALLAGCVQQALAPDINWATLRVLARNGIEVVIPAGQGCCGSLLMHTGDGQAARALARANLRAFSAFGVADVDAILTNAAGCGSGMKEYPLLFKGCPEEDAARAFAARVRDVAEFLVDFDVAPPPLPAPVTLAYHDACHLAHAQGIVDAPRRLLRAIPNLSLVDIPEGELCCGSAGAYSLEQPELAGAIGRRKAENILRTGAGVVAAGNIGCMVQIRLHLERLSRPLPVLHTIEVLDRAYRGEDVRLVAQV